MSGTDTAGMREALRQALHRDVCDALPEGGVTCDDVADALLPVVQRLAVERAAEELRQRAAYAAARAAEEEHEAAQAALDDEAARLHARADALAAAAQPGDGRTGA